jgi:hypothetical protein
MSKPIWAQSRDRHISGDDWEPDEGSKIAEEFYSEHAPDMGSGWTDPHVVHESFPDLVEEVLGALPPPRVYDEIKSAMEWGAYKVGPGPTTGQLTGWDVGDVLYVINACGVTPTVKQYPRKLTARELGWLEEEDTSGRGFWARVFSSFTHR